MIPSPSEHLAPALLRADGPLDGTGEEVGPQHRLVEGHLDPARGGDPASVPDESVGDVDHRGRTRRRGDGAGLPRRTRRTVEPHEDRRVLAKSSAR